MDVHVRDLRYFLAVADELHVTRAAARMFVSQPALSKQIRALEAAVRAPPFARGPGGVSLTAAGRALLPHARAVVAEWDAGRSALAEVVAADARVLVLGLSVSVGRGLLAAVGEAFGERHLDWRLELRQARFGDPTVGLAAGDSDVGFCWLPLPEDPRLQARVLFTEPRMVALPTQHRLAARSEVTMEDLRDEPFLALPESAGPLRAFWLGEDARGGRPARVAAVVHGPEEVVEALGRGTGVALIAAGNAEIYRRPEYVVRPVPGLAPAQLAVAWRAGDPRPAVHDLVAACVDHARRARPTYRRD
ncbi:transcriptional regulator, LysR family [Geodermatophilus pulveris]|uniref:Transcriptional regulator, LysR family n=1 Tax=Geodermatophilus pulveris TaxID=1564159 RepID=A0A239BW30_9ACTN|nr:LysR family transcriptional regulator [Geodermatophilus pulveris]SNS11363.1 transcriptional regulator, LysR family [Geodermatophilus pulveris]